MADNRLALALICYAVTGLLTFMGLAWCRRGTENGLSPSMMGLLWPATVVLLTLYYAAAVIYTLLVVRCGRRLV